LGILGTVLTSQTVASDVESSIQIDIPNGYCKQHGVKIGKIVEVKLCTNLMSTMECVVLTQYEVLFEQLWTFHPLTIHFRLSD